MPEIVAILGAGSWGLAVAHLLNNRGHRVRLWEFDPTVCDRLVRNRQLPEKLTEFTLPEEIQVHNDLAEAIVDARWHIMAVPAQRVRSVVRELARSSAAPDANVVNLAKGIETESLHRMSEVLLEELPVSEGQVVTLSGPSHAEEVVRDMPTTVVAAGASEAVVNDVQRLFSGPYFRVYESRDLPGVELGGSLKNIIAIAAGIADGLGLGDNTKGALITRGLAEVTRLGEAMGARPETFAGLSGIGDLVTTCASRHSRNRFVGEQIARGRTLEDILNRLPMVAEGVDTTRSGYRLAERHGVEMPITTEVYRVLFENKSPSEGLLDLMGRELKPEIWR
jgi:glycerol-3-phosphate dehydrogenase (NAD(P)+)